MNTNCSSHKCCRCGRFVEAGGVRHPDALGGLALLNGPADVSARGRCADDGSVEVSCVRIGTAASSIEETS